LLSPSRAIRKAATTGHALPEIAALRGLYERGVSFRGSQLVMVTGRPKAGKSNLVQWMSYEWRLPALYNCWDMPAFTAAVRHAAIVTGDDTMQITRQLAEDGPGAAYYEEALEGGLLEYCFDTRPELPDIQQEIDAWVEKYDAYPEIIVCDNLLNIDGAEEDHKVQKFILRELQSLARATGALIFVLHHATEGTRDTARPPAARETDGKVNQIPDLVLSVANDGEGGFYLAPVANRNGSSDPNAEHPVRIFADFARMQFSQHRPVETGGWEYR
jgi:hypothetical protein